MAQSSAKFLALLVGLVLALLFRPSPMASGRPAPAAFVAQAPSDTACPPLPPPNGTVVDVSTVAELQAAVDSLAVAMARLKADHGSLDATYGDTFRVGRDDVSWPLGGGGGNGLTTLRNVRYGSERGDQTRWGRGGQTSTQVIVLSKPIRSWTYVPIGQSDRPYSEHYRDQAEKLFGPRKLKPTWWLPKDLAKHTESRVVLSKAP